MSEFAGSLQGQPCRTYPRWRPYQLQHRRRRGLRRDL